MSSSRGQSEHYEHQPISGLVPKAKPPGPLSDKEHVMSAQLYTIKCDSEATDLLQYTKSGEHFQLSL